MEQRGEKKKPNRVSTRDPTTIRATISLEMYQLALHPDQTSIHEEKYLYLSN